MRLFTKALAVVGAAVAALSTTGCMVILFDEAEMPESLL